MHAGARTALRAAREEADSETRQRKAAEEQAATLKTEYDELKSAMEKEKSGLEASLKQLEKGLDEARSQNTLLHSQVETLGEQVEKKMNESVNNADSQDTDEAYENFRKTFSQDRELIKFLKSEKEMVVAQLDTARRAAEREQATAAVVKRSLDEARAELKVLQELKDSNALSETSKDALTVQKKLESAEEKCKLLADSNAHLREEVEKLSIATKTLETQLNEAKKLAGPSEKRFNDMEVEKAALVSEKESLLREIEDWKGRVQSLVSKFNQVDPQEHALALKKVKTLESEIENLKTEKADALDESKRIRNLTTRVSSQLNQHKTLVESQKKEIQKLTTEKEALSKKAEDKVSAKELEEIKQKLTKLESERASEKVQLKGATDMSEKLRDRLRVFQKQNVELNKKVASLTNELNEAQANLKKQQEATELLQATSTDDGETPAVVPPAKSEAPAKKPEAQQQSAKKKLAMKKRQLEAAKEAAAREAKKVKISENAEVPESTSTGTSEVEQTTKQGPKKKRGGKKRAASPAKPEDAPDTKKKNIGEDVEKKESEPSSQEPVEPKSEAEKPESGLNAEAKPFVPPKKNVEEPKSETKKPAMGRRLSGEKKEMSMKEKLLEKKRKLEAAVKKKEAAAEEARKKQSDTSDDPKQNQPAETEAIEAKKKQLAALASAAAGKASQKQDAKSPATAKPAEDKSPEGEDVPETKPSEDEVEVEEGEEPEKSEEKTEEESKAAPTAFGGVPNPFGSLAGQSNTSKMTFGQPSTGFGSGGASSTGFGASAQSSKPLTFGQAAKTGAPSSSGFGGGFASAATAPQFSFGTSGSITLPIPSQKSPQASMFNAFSKPTGFGAPAATPLPLFGGSQPKDAEKEDESPDAAQQEGTGDGADDVEETEEVEEVEEQEEGEEVEEQEEGEADEDLEEGEADE